MKRSAPSDFPRGSRSRARLATRPSCSSLYACVRATMVSSAARLPSALCGAELGGLVLTKIYHGPGAGGNGLLPERKAGREGGKAARPPDVQCTSTRPASVLNLPAAPLSLRQAARLPDGCRSLPVPSHRTIACLR